MIGKIQFFIIFKILIYNYLKIAESELFNFLTLFLLDLSFRSKLKIISP